MTTEFFTGEFYNNPHCKTKEFDDEIDTLIVHNEIEGTIKESIKIPYKHFYTDKERKSHAKGIYNKIASMMRYSLDCEYLLPMMNYTKQKEKYDALPVEVSLEYKKNDFGPIISELNFLDINYLDCFSEYGSVLTSKFINTFESYLAKTLLPSEEIGEIFVENKPFLFFNIKIEYSEIYYEKPLFYRNRIYNVKFVRRIIIEPYT